MKKQNFVLFSDRPVQHSGWQWRLGPGLWAGGFHCHPWLWERGRESDWIPVGLTVSCKGSALLAAGSGSPHPIHTAVPEASGGGANRCSHVIYVRHVYKAPLITIVINNFYYDIFIDPHGVELSLWYQIALIIFLCLRFLGNFSY